MEGIVILRIVAIQWYGWEGRMRRRSSHLKKNTIASLKTFNDLCSVLSFDQLNFDWIMQVDSAASGGASSSSSSNEFVVVTPQNQNQSNSQSFDGSDSSDLSSWFSIPSSISNQVVFPYNESTIRSVRETRRNLHDGTLFIDQLLQMGGLQSEYEHLEMR